MVTIHISLLEKYDHGVTNVETNVAAVVVSDRVAAFLNDEAVPVSLVLPVELFFDFPRDVREVAWVVILKCF